MPSRSFSSFRELLGHLSFVIFEVVLICRNVAYRYVNEDLAFLDSAFGLFRLARP